MEIFSVLLTEISILILGIVLIVAKLLFSRYGFKSYGALSALWLAVTVGLVLWQQENQYRIPMYYTDAYSTYFKVLLMVTAILVFLGSISYVRRLGYYEAEYYIISVFALLGMVGLASSGDLITLYMSLELMTISFIILVGFLRHDNLSTEGAMKYLILSAMSSALLLFGLSYIYGYTGTTIFEEMASLSAQQSDFQPLFILGLIMVIAGFAFKLASVPFHMWAPDIYQGAPAPVAGFLAVGSKAAALAVFSRILLSVFPTAIESWMPLVIVLAVFSIIFGNLVAIPQTNVKRMLAYSSVAQGGYLLLGIIAGGLLGLAALLYYVAAYTFANLGAFLVVAAIEEKTGCDDLVDYAGLGKRTPFLSAAMFVFMVSLGGLPPLGGFIGKFMLFTGVMNVGYLWLALLGLIFGMISVYYYFRVTKAMYVNEPQEVLPRFKTATPTMLALWICIIASVLMGIFFAPFMDLSMTSVLVSF